MQFWRFGIQSWAKLFFPEYGRRSLIRPMLAPGEARIIWLGTPLWLENDYWLGGIPGQQEGIMFGGNPSARMRTDASTIGNRGYSGVQG